MTPKILVEQVTRFTIWSASMEVNICGHAVMKAPLLFGMLRYAIRWIEDQTEPFAGSTFERLTLTPFSWSHFPLWQRGKHIRLLYLIWYAWIILTILLQRIRAQFGQLAWIRLSRFGIQLFVFKTNWHWVHLQQHVWYRSITTCTSLMLSTFMLITHRRTNAFHPLPFPTFLRSHRIQRRIVATSRMALKLTFHQSQRKLAWMSLPVSSLPSPQIFWNHSTAILCAVWHRWTISSG